MKQKNRIKFVAYLFLFTIASLSIGYSAFGTKMNITDIVADIRMKKDIRVTEFNVNSATGNAISQYEEYNHSSVSSKINMPQADSTVTYNIQVTNIGNVEMGIYEFTGIPSNMELVTGNGYTLQEALCDEQSCKLGAKKEFSITLKYKNGGFNSSTTEYNINLDVDFRQMYSVSYEGITVHNYQNKVIEGGNVSVTFIEDIPKKVIPYAGGVKLNNYTYANNQITVENVTSDITLKYLEKVYMKTLSQNAYFKETTYRAKIITASFVNYINTDGALVTYDLGDTGYENEIIAWIDSSYNLYIGSDWNIYSKDLSNAFFSMSKLEAISFDNLNTSETTNMSAMFRNCTGLGPTDFSKLDTSNVTDMSYMFARCRGDFDLSNFNTSKVTTMAYMFQGDTQTNYINLSGFDTSNVTNMSNMFRSGNIKKLDLSHFNTASVTNMSYMFSACPALAELDISGFNTSNVTTMAYMFQNTPALKTLDLSHFNTSKVTNMSYMIAMSTNGGQSSSLTTLDISNFNTSNVTTMAYMFSGCDKITTLDLSHFNTAKVTNMSNMFAYCINLTNLNIDNFNTAKVTNMSSLFSNCQSLQNIQTNKLTTTLTTNMSMMFYNCLGITSLNLSNFNTTKVTNMSSMFEYCENLTSLNISTFNTSNVTTMAKMFSGCKKLTNLDLSHFNTIKVTTMLEMFNDCRNLINLNVDTWNTAKVTNFSYMFSNCINLPALNVNHFNTSAAKNMSSMFYNCTSLTRLDLSNFNSTVLTSLTSMFSECTNLQYLDLSNFTITTSITDYSYFLKNCSNLTDLKINSMDFSIYGGTIPGATSMLENSSSTITITVKDETNKGIIEGILPNGGTVVTA